MAVDIKIHYARIRDLLKSPEAHADVRRRATAIAAVAGKGFEIDSAVGRNRARASVRTVTREARRKNAHELTLLRALDAGRR